MRHWASLVAAGCTLTLCALTMPASPAHSQTFGRWSVSADSDSYLWASTTNDSGHALGQFCSLSEGSCVWLITMSPGCDPGEKYTALANTDAGAEAVGMICGGPLEGSPGRYGYAFNDFDRLTSLVTRGSSRIGIAIPLNGGQFRVVRFDLQGSQAALAAMRSTAASKLRPARRGTRDEQL
ncbi:MAG TPA: hypothetical protein VF136_15405 [Methylomirabilota bacterium]